MAKNHRRGHSRPQSSPISPAPAPAQGESLGPSALAGVFNSGRTGMWGWAPFGSDPNGTEQLTLPERRAASRELERTDPLAHAGIERWVEYVIGKGLKVKPQIDYEEIGITDEQATEWENKTAKRFQVWAKDPRCSVEGDLNFYQLQRLAAASGKASGDVFLVMTRKERQNWPFRTALQLIEADRVSNPSGKTNTNQIFEGIERAVDGEITYIWVANHHPYASYPPKDKKWNNIQVRSPSGRQNVTQWKKIRRPGQSRSMPLMSVITETLKQTSRYQAAEIDAAVSAASEVILAEMSPDSFDQIYGASGPLGDIRADFLNQVIEARRNATVLTTSKITNVFPGETIKSPTPGRPNPNAAPFFELFMDIIAIGLNMPGEVFRGKFTTSYTAAQAAFQQWFQTVHIDREDAISFVCQPSYETWLFDCIADGIIQAPGFFQDPFIRIAYNGSEWTGSGKFVLNPLQEAMAAEKRARFITCEAYESMAYNGGDYEVLHRQRAIEAQNRRNDGLPPLGETLLQNIPPDPDSSTVTP